MRITKCKLKNDQQVLGVLKKNTKGLSAYDVLKELQKYKNIKPMTVYRSLKIYKKSVLFINLIKTKTIFFVIVM